MCDRCHDMTQKCMSFNDFAIAAFRRNDYINNFWFMIKSEAVDIMKYADLSKKRRRL